MRITVFVYMIKSFAQSMQYNVNLPTVFHSRGKGPGHMFVVLPKARLSAFVYGLKLSVPQTFISQTENSLT